MMSQVETFDLEKFCTRKNYAIEASAGTGKTFTITEIVAKLIEEEIPLSKILLVTYTEKAAGELRDRVRKKLVTMLDAAKKSGKNPKRIEKALAEVDSATIGTIHSFCQKTLRDFAYESEMPFALSMASDDILERIIETKIRDEWSEEITQSGLEVESVRSRLLNAVKMFDGKMEFAETPPATEAEAVAQLEQNAEFKERLNVLREHKMEAFTVQKERAGKISSSEKSVSELIGEIEKNIAQKKWSKINANTFGKKTLKASCKELEFATDYFRDLKTEELDDAGKVNLYRFVYGKLGEIYADYQSTKLSNKQQSFDDMIRQVRDAVASESVPTPLCRKLRETYTYAIVDEFQDTNQNQWDIFKTVFLDSSENFIIVVGDPKQSIYSFQGADLEVYEAATKSIQNHAAGILGTLPKNWRSTDAVVEACNEIFSKNFFDEFKLSTASGKILAPQFHGKDLAPICLAQNADGDTFARFAAKKISDLMRLENGKTSFQYFDKDFGGYQSLRFSDIAILARTRSEMDEVERAMSQAGIPFVRYKDSNLFKERSARQWIALLKALDVPDFSGYNRGLLNAALVSDFFRLDLSQVESDEFENPNNPEIEKFRKWRSLLQKRRYAELEESIYSETQIDRYLCDSSKLQALAKIKQVGSYIFEYLYSNGVSLEETIKHLEGLSIDAEDSDDEDGNLIAKASDFDAVQVMTIHASKGLQFPVVISVAGFKDINKSALGPFVYRDSERKIIGFGKKAKNLRQREELGEWRRLFYVDFTRAESLLILPKYNLWKNKNNFGFLQDSLDAETGRIAVEDLNDAAWAEFLGNWEKSSAAEVKKIVQQNLNAEKIQQESGQEQQLQTIAELNRNIGSKSVFQHSYSSLSGKIAQNDYSVEGERLDSEEGESPEIRFRLEDVDPEPKRIIFETESVGENALPDIVRYPKGSKLGNALHQTFELMDFEAIGQKSLDEVESDETFAKLIGKQFESQAFDVNAHPDWIRQSAHFVWHTMNAEFPEIHGKASTGKVFSLKELSSANRLAEMEFHLNAEENSLRNYCKGFMDLLFRRGEYFSILDWKSDVLEDYGKGPQEKVDSDYAVQRVLYSYSLIRWLKMFYVKSEEEIFREHFGGVYYAFVRGCRSGKTSGLYAQTWNTFADLEKSFNRIKGLMSGRKVGGNNV